MKTLFHFSKVFHYLHKCTCKKTSLTENIITEFRQLLVVTTRIFLSLHSAHEKLQQFEAVKLRSLNGCSCCLQFLPVLETTLMKTAIYTHTHTHNHFTAFLEYVRDHPGEQVPER